MKLIGTLACAAMLAAGNQAIHAQCTSQSPTQGICYGSNCEGQYSIPPVCDGGDLNTCGSFLAQCCGQKKQVYSGEGCSDVITRNPVAKETFEVLRREGIQIAVVACDRHLAVFGNPTEVVFLHVKRPLLGPAGF